MGTSIFRGVTLALVDVAMAVPTTVLLGISSIMAIAISKTALFIRLFLLVFMFTLATRALRV